MKACWKCAEQIQDAAIACRFCGANQNSVERQSLGAAPPKSGAESMKPVLKIIFVIVMALLIAKCANDPAPKAESAQVAEPLAETATRFENCKKAEKSGRKFGIIRDIPPATQRFGGNWYEIVVDETLWKREEYNTKMTLALLPLCLAKAGDISGEDDYVMVKSNLTDATLAGGSPAAGTVSVESD